MRVRGFIHIPPGRWLGIGMTMALAVLVWSISAAEASDFPKTFTGSDPKGWGSFKWQMTKPQTVHLGAVAYRDGDGEKRLGLPEVELLPGKKFQVRLEFYSHTGLNSIQVTLIPNTQCAREVYETFLNNFREEYGPELETRNLDFPNSRYQSHDWIVGSTKIVLHHGCPKPGKPTSTQPTTHIWYEKRLEYEPWNQ